MKSSKCFPRKSFISNFPKLLESHQDSGRRSCMRSIRWTLWVRWESKRSVLLRGTKGVWTRISLDLLSPLITSRLSLLGDVWSMFPSLVINIINQRRDYLENNLLQLIFIFYPSSFYFLWRFLTEELYFLSGLLMSCRKQVLRLLPSIYSLCPIGDFHQ